MKWIPLGLLLLCLGACRSTNRINNSTVESEVDIAEFYIPLLIGQEDLQGMINRQLDSAGFEESLELEEGKWRLWVKKAAPVSFRFEDRTVTYTATMEVKARRDLWLGHLAATGVIRLDFATQWKPGSDWSFDTQTELIDYHWEKKPKAGWGPIQVPVRSIADKVLERSRNDIVETLNEEIRRNLDLRDHIMEVWEELRQPRLVDAERDLWLHIRPQQLRLSPVLPDKSMLMTTLFVSARTALLHSRDSTGWAQDAALPPLEWIDEKSTQSDFQVHLPLFLPFSTLQDLAAREAVGQSFEKGNTRAEVSAIRLYPEGGRVGIELDLKGGFEGRLYISGLPVFSPQRKVLSLAHLKASMQGGNLLQKSLIWLFKNRIRKAMEKQLTFELEEQLTHLQEDLQSRMRAVPLGAGLILRSDIRELAFREIRVKEQGLQLELSASGLLQIEWVEGE